MHRIAHAIFALFAAGAALVGFEEARQSITADEIRAHLYFLSHDDLRGRAPGSQGGAVAARYIATQFLSMGLQPVNGAFMQEVPIHGITTDPTTLSLAFETGETRVAASYPDEAVIWPGTTRPVVQVNGELVFVGYGVDAPAWGWDDFKGRDLNGKVLVFLVGDPPTPPDEPTLFDGRAMTYYGRWTYKLEEARRRGATGALIIHRDETAGYGWDVVRSSWTGEQFMLDERPDDGGAVLLHGWLREGYAERVFEAAGLDLSELYVRAARRDFRPVATGLVVRSRMNSRSRTVITQNVVGYLPGADRERGDEVVAFTSHYDHLGTGTPVDGDSIYNGAYDNAGGVGVLLEVAQAFTRLDERPARSTLFIATAAEEAGLLGSEFYIRNPLFPLERTVAAINVDGANIWGRTRGVVGLGADRSTLGELLATRAEEAGLQVMPDPAPERGSFFRSDQFPFARAGIPVLNIRHGTQFVGRPDGWGDAEIGEYNVLRYHRPGDEYDPAFDLEGAVQQARLIFSVGFDVANWDRIPEWFDGAEFKAARDRMMQ